MPSLKTPAAAGAAVALEGTLEGKALLEGVALVELPGKGRALVATRRFGVGALVLKEPPVLVWREAETPFLPFLKAFLVASPEQQVNKAIIGAFSAANKAKFHEHGAVLATHSLRN